MENESKAQAKRQEKKRVGPERLPPPDVMLVFHGLSGVWVDGNSCVFGFHTKGDPKHPLTIDVYDDSCSIVKSFSGDLKKLNLEIYQPNMAIARKALFYQPDGKRIRRDTIQDPYDFQWNIDLEARECYGSHVDVSLSTYKPQIKISHAIFYTLKTTLGKFRIRTTDASPVPGNGANFSEMGPVAEYIAANIYLIPDLGSVTLTVDNERLEPISKGEIHFLNDCRDGNDKCEWEPKGNDKKKRNDFYLHYKAITQLPELELVLRDEVDEGGPPDGLCSANLRSNDNAPCAGVGYGGGGGFPPYPEG